MSDAKPNLNGFPLHNKMQLKFFRIKAASFGPRFKVLPRVLFNLIVRATDKIRMLWKQNRRNVKEYLLKNWGSPFLVSFIVLLAGSAVSLSVGPSTVDTLLVCAFYALAVGVVLQFASFLKYEQKTNNTAKVPS